MNEIAAAAIAGAWTRWQRYHELRHGREDLSLAETEAQLELVATGLAFSDEQVQELFKDDAAPFAAFLTPFPPFQDDVDRRNRFHLTFVSAGMLLEQFLRLHNRPDEQVRRLLTGPVVHQVLLPVLQLDCFSSLHSEALKMLQTLVRRTGTSAQGQKTLMQLFGRVQKLLRGDKETAATSCGSLCRVAAVLLQQKVEKLQDSAMQVCGHATRRWHRQPQLLRGAEILSFAGPTINS